MPNNSRRIAAKHTQLSGRGRKSKKMHSPSQPKSIKKEPLLVDDPQELRETPSELKVQDKALIETPMQSQEHSRQSMLLKEMRYIGIIAGVIALALIAFSVSLA
jgi:hypothetical protein